MSFSSKSITEGLLLAVTVDASWRSAQKTKAVVNTKAPNAMIPPLKILDLMLPLPSSQGAAADSSEAISFWSPFLL